MSAKITRIMLMGCLFGSLFGGSSILQAATPSGQGLTNIIWGAATNSLRAGIWAVAREIVVSAGQKKNVTAASLARGNTSTNFLRVYLPKSPEQRIALEMFDSNKVAVARTSYGKTIGQPPVLKPGTPWYHWKREGFGPAVMFPNEDDAWFKLDPTKYFVLNKPGDYQLTAVQRVYIAGTNEILSLTYLPPVAIKVRVEASATKSVQ